MFFPKRQPRTWWSKQPAIQTDQFSANKTQTTTFFSDLPPQEARDFSNYEIKPRDQNQQFSKKIPLSFDKSAEFFEFKLDDNFSECGSPVNFIQQGWATIFLLPQRRTK